MFRIVYYDGIGVRDIWFETDREQLKFSLTNNSYKILEWKKYENREDAKPLSSFVI